MTELDPDTLLEIEGDDEKLADGLERTDTEKRIDTLAAALEVKRAGAVRDAESRADTDDDRDSIAERDDVATATRVLLLPALRECDGVAEGDFDERALTDGSAALAEALTLGRNAETDALREIDGVPVLDSVTFLLDTDAVDEGEPPRRLCVARADALATLRDGHDEGVAEYECVEDLEADAGTITLAGSVALSAMASVTGPSSLAARDTVDSGPLRALAAVHCAPLEGATRKSDASANQCPEPSRSVSVTLPGPKGNADAASAPRAAACVASRAPDAGSVREIGKGAAPFGVSSRRTPRGKTAGAAAAPVAVDVAAGAADDHAGDVCGAVPTKHVNNARKRIIPAAGVGHAAGAGWGQQECRLRGTRDQGVGARGVTWSTCSRNAGRDRRLAYYGSLPKLPSS